MAVFHALAQYTDALIPVFWFTGFIGLLLFAVGKRRTLCAFPGLLICIALAAGINEFLTPNQYPGDLFAAILPLFQGIAWLIALVPLLLVFNAVKRLCLAAANKYFGPARPVPRLSAQRLSGLAILAVSALCVVGLEKYESHKGDMRREAFEHTRDAFIRDYASGKTDKATFLAQAEQLAGTVWLNQKSYAADVDALARSDPQKAKDVLDMFHKHNFLSYPPCATLKDMVASRLRDGKAEDLDFLLSEVIRDQETLLAPLLQYLANHKDGQTLERLFTAWLAECLSGGDKAKNLASKRISALLQAVRDPALFAKLCAIGGNRPYRYLTEFEGEGLTSTLLTSAAHDLDFDRLKLLIDAGFTKDSTRYGSTALMFFRTHGGAAAIRELLAAGGDANAANDKGETPLLLLTASRQHKPRPPGEEEKVARVSKLLLSICPPVNRYLTGEKESLLHVACDTGKFSPEGIEETKILLKAGADPEKADSKGRTPVLLAREKGLEQVSAILEKAGKTGAEATTGVLKSGQNH